MKEHHKSVRRHRDIHQIHAAREVDEPRVSLWSRVKRAARTVAVPFSIAGKAVGRAAAAVGRGTMFMVGAVVKAAITSVVFVALAAELTAAVFIDTMRLAGHGIASVAHRLRPPKEAPALQ